MANEEEARIFLKFWVVMSYMCIGARLVSNAYEEVLEDITSRNCDVTNTNHDYDDYDDILNTYDIIEDID
jgi:hypothetical protein